MSSDASRFPGPRAPLRCYLTVVLLSDGRGGGGHVRGVHNLRFVHTLRDLRSAPTLISVI